jgi:dephospho-CoA kinase
MTAQQARERDWAEIENLEKGGPIAIADHTIINNKDLDWLYTQIDDELEHIKFYK